MHFVFPERRPRRIALACVATFVVLASPLRAQQPTICSTEAAAGATPDTSQKRVGGLRSGDLLKISVFRAKEISGEYIIDTDGRLVIPGLGVLPAAGAGPRDVEERLRALLVCRGIVPDVSVQALIRISVLGEVRNQGTFPSEPGISLLRVLTLAGGPTPQADLKRTRVVREGRSYPVDLDAALRGNASGSVILNSNDVVVVPKRSGFTREDASFLFSIVGVLASVASMAVTLSR